MGFVMDPLWTNFHALSASMRASISCTITTAFGKWCGSVPMIELIENRRAALSELCRKFQVKKLEVFGSAADGEFDANRSDLDFLVEFQPVETGRIAPDYFGLLHALEDLFERKVDLVMDRAIRNPYFRRGVDQSRTPIYAA
jgi:uncharacterized protein